MNLRPIIEENGLGVLFQQATFGLEKESQRVYINTSIAKTGHPKCFGNRSFHPYIQTDFAESQLELITPPMAKLEDTMRWLAAIHQVVQRSIPKDEYILPCSMPVLLPDEKDIQVAKLDNLEDVAYREYLVKVYGKNKQMVSGIHYNFQLDPELISVLFNAQNTYQDKQDFQNQLYLKLAKNFLRYQWLIVYLFSASPVAADNYFKKGEFEENTFVRSLRSSKYGYVNDPEIKVSFDSLAEYVESLEHWVNSGKLIAEKEFYSNVRLRGGKRARDFLTTGIKYLEFRLFDLNPFEIYGINLDDARFIHHFLLFMLWMEDTATAEDVELGKQRLSEVALEHPYDECAYAMEGELLLTELIAMLKTIGCDSHSIKVAEDKLNQLQHPEQTICGRFFSYIDGGEEYYCEFLLTKMLANKHHDTVTTYSLPAFENMELSTQALLFDAIQKGLKVEILDENEQFISLQFADHIEYVKNGNMTSRDSYIAPLIMENKVVTKKVLAKAGFNVPHSVEFREAEKAIASFELFKGKAVVIKPKSTNYGLGITIFKQGVQDYDDFSAAVKIAFAEDKEIMIEDYLEGTEYRFFVLGGKTLAVLLRVPANVVGDGERTIAELVAIKNTNPLRGDGSRTPLKRIALGEIELLQLKEQGFAIDSTPARDQVVQLRVNSNISTGGDSIDVTNQMHQSYKDLAVGISKAMGAEVCGVDLIIPDLTKPAEPNIKSWGVIEANFNPMMMMHIYPYQGYSRRLTLDVLNMLFPELGLFEQHVNKPN